MIMRRRGFLLLEVIVSSVLLAALTMVCLKYFLVAAAQRQSTDQRLTAMREAENIMERLSVRPWSELTPETLSKQSLSPEIQRFMPDAELKIDIADEETKPPAKRITVSIRWQDQNGQWTEPVRLVAWSYRP
jgi:Tfp pilus assembly protein PilV